MDDKAISLNAAIDAININNGILYDNPTLVASLHKLLSELPPAQPKQQWIPCTPETMPEKEGRYICTYTYDGKKDVFMFRFEDGDFLVPWYVDAITAWYKPLDPWEGGQE